MKETDSKIKRLLIVESHAAFRQALAFVLDQHPQLVIAAQTGLLADSYSLALNGIDLAIIDPSLPDGDGIDLIRAIRKFKDRYIPVIALTGSADPAIRGQLLEAGADEVLTKGVDLEEMVDVLEGFALAY